jgi:hypothetical protein
MSDLSGVVLVRTLKASPVPSSSELIGNRAHGQGQGTGWGEVGRVVDHDIRRPTLRPTSRTGSLIAPVLAVRDSIMTLSGGCLLAGPGGEPIPPTGQKTLQLAQRMWWMSSTS